MGRRSMVGIIAVVAIVAVAMFAGCVEETDEPQDSQWAASCSGRLKIIQLDIGYMQEDLASGNSALFTESAKDLQDDAQYAYDISIQYTVSPEYEPMKSEYEKALLDYVQVGKYASAGDFDTASYYTDSGTARMNRVNDMLDLLNGVQR
jgi:hypothetical protein